MNIDNYDRAAQLQRQIEQARLEKQARAANDPDRVISDAQRELEQISLQHRESKLNAAVGQNVQLQEENEAGFSALMGELQIVLQQLLDMQTPDQLQASLDYQLAFQRQAVALFMSAGPSDRWRAENDATNPIVSQNAELERQGEAHAAAGRFPPMMNRVDRFNAWIATASDERERRIRYGLILAVYGKV